MPDFLELFLADAAATMALGAALARAYLGAAPDSSKWLDPSATPKPSAESEPSAALDPCAARASNSSVRSGGPHGSISTPERSAVLYLHGDLGAGKTTCVRGLLRAFGVEGLIRSPTYTLVESYAVKDILYVHVDLYRLHGTAEVDELGLRDYFEGECLLLVEWPEKGAGALPSADLELTLSYRDDSRNCRLTATTARGRHWLDNLARDTSLTPYVSNLT